jgi:4-hydroxybenzoyl-CoA reductase subunit beta
MDRVAPFELHRPSTAAEAAAILARTPGARIVAGGTDLMPNLRHGLGAPPALVDATAIEGFASIDNADGGWRIGAGLTLARLASDRVIAAALPALRDAAASVAGPSHRTVATLGGNLCVDTRCVFYNQSEWWRRANAYCLKHGGDTCHVAPQGDRCHAAWSGDLAPVLIALDASVEVVGVSGVRVLPLAELYVDDGRRPLALAPDELLAAVIVPPQPAGARSGYRKARVRGAIDFPLAGVAARVVARGGAIAALRVALAGTNSRPLLLAHTDTLVGAPLDSAALAKLVQRQTSPMRTTVTGANYRRVVAAALAQRLVAELAQT